MYKLFARAGWGSALVEAQLAWYGLPFTIEEVGDLFQSAEARERLAAVNPVAQVPTLVLPDGRIMTESAAITLYLADVAGKADLVPAASETTRPSFLRWLVFLVANVYPTFHRALSNCPRRRRVSRPESMPTRRNSIASSKRKPERPGSWANGCRRSTSISP